MFLGGTTRGGKGTADGGQGWPRPQLRNACQVERDTLSGTGWRELTASAPKPAGASWPHVRRNNQRELVCDHRRELLWSIGTSS